MKKRLIQTGVLGLASLLLFETAGATSINIELSKNAVYAMKLTSDEEALLSDETEESVLTPEIEETVNVEEAIPVTFAEEELEIVPLKFMETNELLSAGVSVNFTSADGIVPDDYDDEEFLSIYDSEYADLAIANVRNYVNVRSEPSTDGKIVGKIYAGAVAHVLELAGPENDWFKIISGNCEGYIKAEYFYYGRAALEVIDEYITKYATVNVTTLNVRKEAKVDSSKVGYISNGEKVKIIEDLGDWLKIQYTDIRTGYIASEYVTVTEEFVYGKTLEEEAAEKAAQKALQERQAQANKVKENTTIVVTNPAGNYANASELRQAIVDYAKQFVGNKYISGGQSLVTGTDCSGFTSLVYAEFGYTISRTPGGQYSGAGRSVSVEELQVGDIVCFGSGKCTHVALYIGDGQIVHEANSRKGCIISGINFMNILGFRNVID